jgi:hypothetical protein
VETGINYKPVESTLWRLYRNERILRNVHPFRESRLHSRGRGGLVRNLRNYFLYTRRPTGIDELEIDGLLFCVKQPKPDGQVAASKAKKIRTHLQNNIGAAYFSKELVERLAVKPSDIMSTVRRLERQGRVFVRGYREGDRETPFKQGYLITWVDDTLGRDNGLRNALTATSGRLNDEEDTNPFMMRIRIIRDCVVTAGAQKQIVSKDFLKGKLHCTSYELDTSIRR